MFHKTLTDLSQDKTIKVCSFDKGNGLVQGGAVSPEPLLESVLSTGTTEYRNCLIDGRFPLVLGYYI